MLVVRGVCLHVQDDVGEQVGSLYPAARCVVAQRGEVHVQVVVGRLVVQVDAQLTRRDTVSLKNGLL